MTEDETELTAQMMHDHAEVFLAHCRHLGVPESEARAALDTPQVSTAANLLALQVLVLLRPAAGSA